MKRLLSTNSRMETRILADVFKLYHIPCFAKSVGSGEYARITTGFCVSGEDVYIQEEYVEQAIEIVEMLKKKHKKDIDYV
ncbi:MAG: hypothetical protein PHD70_02125 [Anaerostipes sp.]|nr:hypothetical protein [Anaerostipes sp.]